MSTTFPSAAWIRAGLVALPVYWVVVGLATLKPQPDQITDPDGWARFVSSPTYLAEHLAGNVVGPVLAVLGTLALAGLLSAGPARRLAVWGTALTVAGHLWFMVPGTLSTFTTPAIGTAYLNGNRDALTMGFSPLLGPIVAAALVFAVVGHIVLGLAIWRCGVLPRWAGLVWIGAAVIFYVLGAFLGMATTGASLPTQPVGALLLAISSAWIAWTVHRTRPMRDPARSDLPISSTSRVRNGA